MHLDQLHLSGRVKCLGFIFLTKVFFLLRMWPKTPLLSISRNHLTLLAWKVAECNSTLQILFDCPTNAPCCLTGQFAIIYVSIKV